jgi:hypothetical protein
MFSLQRKMCVTAVDDLGSARLGMGQGSFPHIGRKPQPGGAQLVEQAHQPQLARIQLLQLQVYETSYCAQQRIADQEAVKLMAMNCQVPLPAILPRVFLVDLYTHQMGKDS